MNYETLKSICETLNGDAQVVSQGGVAALTLDDVEGFQTACNVADFPLRIYPLGDSQTSSAGELNANGYFALTETLDDLRRIKGRGADFLALGERLVALLHRSCHGGQNVFFSKSVIAHSSFMLQNNNRRINVKVGADQIVQVFFFWTTGLSLERLDAALETTAQSGSATGTTRTGTASTASSLSGDETDAEATGALAAAAELFP